MRKLEQPIITPPVPDYLKEVPHPVDSVTNHKSIPKYLKDQIRNLIELCKKKEKSPEEYARLLRESDRVAGQLETFSS